MPRARKKPTTTVFPNGSIATSFRLEADTSSKQFPRTRKSKSQTQASTPPPDADGSQVGGKVVATKPSTPVKTGTELSRVHPTKSGLVRVLRPPRPLSEIFPFSDEI